MNRILSSGFDGNTLVQDKEKDSISIHLFQELSSVINLSPTLSQVLCLVTDKLARTFCALGIVMHLVKLRLGVVPTPVPPGGEKGYTFYFSEFQSPCYLLFLPL